MIFDIVSEAHGWGRLVFNGAVTKNMVNFYFLEFLIVEAYVWLTRIRQNL